MQLKKTQDSQLEQKLLDSSTLVEIEDPFVVRMINREHQKEIKKLEEQFNIIIHIDEGYGQIQILPGKDNIDEHIEDHIIQQIKAEFSKIERAQSKKIVEQYVECNRDLYQKLEKVIKRDHQQIANYHLNFIGNEAQLDDNQNKIYDPLVIKSIDLQNKFLFQLFKIEQPEYLNFQEIDVLVLNMTHSGLFVDEFGYALQNSNPHLKQVIKELKPQIKKSKFIDEVVFRQGSKNVSLMIQLEEDEQTCIENLKYILNKLKDQKFKQRGNLKIAIALRECCAKNYVTAFSDYIKSIANQKTFLNFPTEISFIVNDRTENLISQQFEALKKIAAQEKEKLGLLSLFSQKSKNSTKEQRVNDEQALQPSLLCIRGEDQSVRTIVKLFKDLQAKSFISYEIKLNNGSLSEELQTYLKELAVKQTLDIKISEDNVNIYAYRKTVNKYLPIISNQIKSTQSLLRIKCRVPDNWEDQKENLKIVDLSLQSTEAQQCISAMNKTIKPKVLRVRRIQNIKLWRNFIFEKEKLAQKGNNTEMLLFHGTRNNKPDLIYNGTEEGFDFRLSAHGMYGRGTYFHETASYSDGYAYVQGTTKQFFLAQVLVGKFYVGGSSSYVAPPVIPGTNGVKFDSIRSNYNEGNNMFIIYHNSKAYPTYLIDYTYS